MFHQGVRYGTQYVSLYGIFNNNLKEKLLYINNFSQIDSWVHQHQYKYPNTSDQRIQKRNKMYLLLRNNVIDKAKQQFKKVAPSIKILSFDNFIMRWLWVWSKTAPAMIQFLPYITPLLLRCLCDWSLVFWIEQPMRLVITNLWWWVVTLAVPTIVQIKWLSKAIFMDASFNFCT